MRQEHIARGIDRVGFGQSRRDGERLGQAAADLELDATRGVGDRRSRDDVARGVHLEIQPRSRAEAVVNVVVNQACVTPQGAALSGRLEVRFAADSVLVIRELVAERAQHLGEHVADVGFEAILPLGIALGCEIEQRPAETPEVARAVVHREIHGSVGCAIASLFIERW